MTAWTKEPPTEPGYYWERCPDVYMDPIIVTFVELPVRGPGLYEWDPAMEEYNPVIAGDHEWQRVAPPKE